MKYGSRKNDCVEGYGTTGISEAAPARHLISTQQKFYEETRFEPSLPGEPANPAGIPYIFILG